MAGGLDLLRALATWTPRLEQLNGWWTGLTAEQQTRARAIAQRESPRAMSIDDLTASMLLAGLPTSRQIWTGQPESLVEMLDEVAVFVLAQS